MSQVRGYMGDNDTQPPLTDPHELIAVLTMEKANVAVNRLISAQRLHELVAVVVDEAHMVADPGRYTQARMQLLRFGGLFITTRELCDTFPCRTIGVSINPQCKCFCGLEHGSNQGTEHSLSLDVSKTRWPCRALVNTVPCERLAGAWSWSSC
jgi:hypothetical protein